MILGTGREICNQYEFGDSSRKFPEILHIQFVRIFFNVFFHLYWIQLRLDFP